jgi:colanic acid biosynthesis glycosyl transferase WcaI
MKIFIHDYAGHPFQAQLSRSLASRGHEVTHGYADNLETPRGALELREGDPQSLRFWAVPMSSDYRKFKYSFIKRRQFERDYGKILCRELEAISPDVVISGNTPSEPQYHFAKACRSAGIPFISWIQDFYSIAVERLVRQKYPILAPLIVPIYRGWDRKAFGLSDHIVSITDDFVPILKNLGCSETPCTVIPNWAPLDEIRPMPKEGAKWAKKQHLDDKFIFLYTGTLAMKHNPGLIASLAAQFKGDDEVRIIVTSEGPGRRWLEESKQKQDLENLLLFDFQPFREYSEVLASASVLVAILEPDAGVFSVPSKVLSYLCAERPLLLSIPSENLAAKTVVHCEAGLTAEPDDERGFVEAAVQLRHDAEARKMMGKKARAYAEEHFNIEKITDRFEAIFTGALSR